MKEYKIKDHREEGDRHRGRREKRGMHNNKSCQKPKVTMLLHLRVEFNVGSSSDFQRQGAYRETLRITLPFIKDYFK